MWSIFSTGFQDFIQRGNVDRLRKFSGILIVLYSLFILIQNLYNYAEIKIRSWSEIRKIFPILQAFCIIISINIGFFLFFRYYPFKLTEENIPKMILYYIVIPLSVLYIGLLRLPFWLNSNWNSQYHPQIL